MSIDTQNTKNMLAVAEEEEEEEEESLERGSEDEDIEDEDEDGSDVDLAQEIAQAAMAGILAQITASVQTPGTVNDGSKPDQSQSVSDLSSSQRPLTSQPLLPSEAHTPNDKLLPTSSKILSALDTIQNILLLASRKTLVHSMLSNLIIPDTGGSNVYDTLCRLRDSKLIPKDIARSLSPLLLSLATSELLFPPLQTSSLPEPGKRKRSETQWQNSDGSPVPQAKRPVSTQQPYSLHLQLDHAASTIDSALESVRDAPFSPAHIASIQHPLYHIFLFAATFCVDLAKPTTEPLREVAALVQLLGVLASVPITGVTAAAYSPPVESLWSSPPAPHMIDVATAVHACTFPACHKVFLRLHALRVHSRVHLPQQPFACSTCSASFVSANELARHSRLHGDGGPVWRCGACTRVLTTVRALERHRSRGRDRGTPCMNATTDELESMPTRDPFLEEGEIHADALRSAQSSVIRLLPLLRRYVGRTVPSLALAVTPSSTEQDGTHTSAPLSAVMTKAQEQINASVDGQHLTVDNWGAFAPTGLSVEQTRLVGQAILDAMASALRQVEALATMEEDDERGENEIAEDNSAAHVET